MSGKQDIIGTESVTPRDGMEITNKCAELAANQPRVIPMDDDDENQDNQSSQMSYDQQLNNGDEMQQPNFYNEENDAIGMVQSDLRAN